MAGKRSRTMATTTAGTSSNILDLSITPFRTTTVSDDEDDHSTCAGGGCGGQGSCWGVFSTKPEHEQESNGQTAAQRLGASAAATIRRHYGKKKFYVSADGEGDDDDDFDEEEDIAISMGKAFAKLSVEERNVITEEIHGVVSNSGSGGSGTEENDVEADPIFVDHRIHQLQEELRKIPKKEKVDYRRACFLAPSKYSDTNRKFHLMFLRSTRFDTKLAAEKIVSFFKLKTKLFGSEMVAKDITWDDLGEEERNALLTLNTATFLPLPDMAGRKIIFGSFFHVAPQVKARAEFYLIMREVENDEMVQKHGVIAVAYDVGVPFAVQSRCANTIIADVFLFLPFKFTCFHYCYSNPALHVTFTIFFRLFRKYVGARFREHFGNHVEAHVSRFHKRIVSKCAGNCELPILSVYKFTTLDVTMVSQTHSLLHRRGLFCFTHIVLSDGLRYSSFSLSKRPGR